MSYQKALLFSLLFHGVVLHAQTPPSFTFDEKRVEKGDTVQVCAFVEDFTNVASVQYTVTWDNQILTYLYSGDYTLPGLSEFNFAEHLADQGILPFVWFDNAVLGVALPDSSRIFCLYFETLGDIGDTSAVNFSGTPTSLQVGVLLDNRIREVEANYTDGRVEIVESILQVRDSVAHNLCWGDTGGSITVQASGGAEPYDYYWSGPEGFAGRGDRLNNLMAGSYTLVLTDSLGRQRENTYEVTQPDLPLTIEQSDLQSSECGQANGAISLRAGGGTPPYTYNFGNGFSTDTLFSNLLPGAYDIVIADRNGCQLDTALVVPSGTNAQIDLGPDIFLCTPATARLNATSGLGAYQWFRNEAPLAETGNELTVSETGTYRLAVETPEGCVLTDTVEVTALTTALNLGEDVLLCPTEEKVLSTPAGMGTYQWFRNGAPLPEMGNELTVSETGTYRLNVQTAQGCLLTDEVEVALSEVGMVDLGGDITICPNETVSIIADGVTGAYQWFRNSSPLTPKGDEILVNNDGTYRVEVTTPEGCLASGEMTVRFSPIEAFASGDGSMVVGDSTRLTAFEGVSYQWTPSETLSCNQCADPIARPEESTTYVARIITADGCEVSDSVFIEVLPAEEKLKVTAVTFLSPNGDGENDVLFFPGLEDYTSNTLTIFSRWGQVLFSRSDYQLRGELWDATLRGQPLPAGIYYYVLRVNEREITIKNTLTVVRE